MSHTKRFLEQISVQFGFQGEINEKVIEEAIKFLTKNLDTANNLTVLYNDISKIDQLEKNNGH